MAKANSAHDKCDKCGSTKSKTFWDYKDGTVLCDKCEQEQKKKAPLLSETRFSFLRPGKENLLTALKLFAPVALFAILPVLIYSLMYGSSMGGWGMLFSMVMMPLVLIGIFLSPALFSLPLVTIPVLAIAAYIFAALKEKRKQSLLSAMVVYLAFAFFVIPLALFVLTMAANILIGQSCTADSDCTAYCGMAHNKSYIDIQDPFLIGDCFGIYTAICKNNVCTASNSGDIARILLNPLVSVRNGGSAASQTFMLEKGSTVAGNSAEFQDRFDPHSIVFDAGDFAASSTAAAKMSDDKEYSYFEYGGATRQTAKAMVYCEITGRALEDSLNELGIAYSSKPMDLCTEQDYQPCCIVIFKRA